MGRQSVCTLINTLDFSQKNEKTELFEKIESAVKTIKENNQYQMEE